MNLGFNSNDDGDLTIEAAATFDGAGAASFDEAGAATFDGVGATAAAAAEDATTPIEAAPLEFGDQKGEAWGFAG